MVFVSRFKGGIANPAGSQIAAQGLYRDTITNLIDNYPSLKYREDLDTELMATPRVRRAALIRLDSGSDNLIVSDRTVFMEPSLLKRQLEWSSGEQPSFSNREILLLEGLDPEFVAIIGQHWMVDPRVFLQHKVNSVWNLHHLPQGAAPTPVPSSRSQTVFNIPYVEPRYLNRVPESEQLRCAVTHRYISTTSIGQSRDQVGILYRRASFWCTSSSEAGWRALLIVDPPVDQIIVGKPEEATFERLANVPYQGGYPDLVEWQYLSDLQSIPGPPRTCMFDDLVHYFEHIPYQIDSSLPSSSTSFLLNIVAQHYLHVHSYNRGLFDQLEFQLDRRENFAFKNTDQTLQAFWSDLHHFRRRNNYSLRHMSSILHQLDIDPDLPRSSRTDSYWGIRAEQNFMFLLRRFQELNDRSSAMLSAYSVLANIASSHQSLSEARAAENLQVLATVFLPLAFTASVFSVNDQYLAGNAGFWIYVVVSIVMLVLVACFTVLLREKTRRWLCDRIMLRRKQTQARDVSAPPDEVNGLALSDPEEQLYTRDTGLSGRSKVA